MYVNSLSSKEQEVFDSLRSHFFAKKYAPSIADLKDIWGQSSISTLQNLLQQLREKGFIDWTNGRARTYRLTVGNMPLRGVVQAGYVVEQPSYASAYIDVPAAHYRLEDYALRVQGDSMIDAHICDGDFVILRPVNQIDELKPGAITAVWVEENAGTTLKHVYQEKDRVILKPANKAYKPQSYRPEHVHPQGRLIGLYRRSVNVTHS